MEYQQQAFHVAVIVLCLAVFGEASTAKIRERKVPDWFIDQFKDTWLGRFPIAPMYWSIALFELGLTCLFTAALVTTEFTAGSPNVLTGYGLIGAMVLFSMLCFGQRVSFDFASAATSFVYAGVSGILWYVIMQLQ